MDAFVAFLLAPSQPFLSPSVTGVPLAMLLAQADDSGFLMRLASWVIAVLLWSVLVGTAVYSRRRAAAVAFFILLGILSVLLLISYATAFPVCT